MTILLVAALILGLWSIEQTAIWAFAPKSSPAWKNARYGSNLWGVMCGGCLIAAGIVG